MTDTQHHRPGRQEDHRRRPRRGTHRVEAVRMVCWRRDFTQGSCQEGAGCRPRLRQERRESTGQHHAHDPAQSALYRPVRMERQAHPGQARTTRLDRPMGARAGRDERTPREEIQAWQARLRLLRADRLSCLRLRGSGRNQEGKLRLLSLHRLR